MARLLQVYPVPALRLRTDGVVEIVDYRPAPSDGLPGLPGAPDHPSPTIPLDRPAAQEDPPPPRVQAWKNSLLDLTLRNRLLNSCLLYTSRCV